jgi:hypothetical protein
MESKLEKEAHNGLACVRIEDEAGYRVYVATNGRTLFYARTPKPNDDGIGEKGINLRINQKFTKKDSRFGDLEFEWDESNGRIIQPALGYMFTDDQSCNYPEWRKVVPNGCELANYYVAFNPDYLKKVNKFLDVVGLIPYGEDWKSPQLFKKENDEDKFAIIMPVRPENYKK